MTGRVEGEQAAQDLFAIQIPVAEKLIRTVAVYGGIAILLRVAGKPDLAQLSTFDLVVMLLLSNVVQNAIIGADNSLSGGLLGAVVLVAANAVWVRVVARSGRVEDDTPASAARFTSRRTLYFVVPARRVSAWKSTSAAGRPSHCTWLRKKRCVSRICKRLSTARRDSSR